MTTTRSPRDAEPDDGRDADPPTECSDEPKLTAEEWSYVEAMSAAENGPR